MGESEKRGVGSLEHIFGLSAGGLYAFGKWGAQRGYLGDVTTGNEIIDSLINDNLSSTFGWSAAFYGATLINSALGGKDKTFLFAGFAAASIMHREFVLDPESYGNGVDYLDVYGGLGALALSTILALASGRRKN